MIESIQFKNFKCLRDTTLPLSPCTILVGPNGSGKTTVLQALEAVGRRREFSFDNIVTVGQEDEEGGKVEVRLKWGEPYVGVESIMRWERGKKPHVGFDDQAGARDVNRIRELIANIRIFSLDAAAIAGPAVVSDKTELQSNGAGLAAVLDGLNDEAPERFEAINSAVDRWLPEFDRILFRRPGHGKKSIVMRTREGQHQISAADLSQGTLFTLAMLTLAYLPEPPSVVGLEEPDRGIHPRLLRHVQDAIYRLSHPDSREEKRKPVQVIATTHSPYFLDLFKDHPEEIVIANKVGLDVRFERLSEQPHIQEMLGDAPLGEIWYTGVLGGVPSGS